MINKEEALICMNRFRNQLHVDGILNLNNRDIDKKVENVKEYLLDRYYRYDTKVNSNFSYIKDMSIDELTDWLDKYGQFDGSPWMDWFNNNYCSKCEPIKCKVDEKDAFWPGHTMDCAYCELEKKCKHFPQLDNMPDNKDIIKMWLMQECTNK